MTCNDCPNQLADSDMCCHPSTKYHGTDFDDRANDEADRHPQMMQKQRKTDSVSSVGPMIDWTAADYALKQSVAQTRQKDLKAVNHQTIDDEADRKQSVNQQFWHSMKEIIFIIVCAAIIVYTLIHFA